MHLFARLFLTICAAAAALSASDAQAQARNAGDVTLAVAIVDGCTVSTREVRFGLIVGTAATVRATGGVDVNCTTNLPFTVSMDRGQNGLGVNRRMRNPSTGGFIRYDLFSDPAYSKRWTNQNAGKVSKNSGSTGRVSLPVFGEMYFDGLPVAGRYDDYVTVTVDF